MGSSESSSDAFLSDYTFQKTCPVNACTILKHKHTNSTLLLRQVSFTSKIEFDTFLKRSYSRRGLMHQHYLTLQEVIYKSEGNICSAIYKASILYQYGNHTLQHQIETRTNQDRAFQERELWSVICSTVFALAFLEKQNIWYETISPSDIFLDSEGLVRIPDPDLGSANFNGGFTIKQNNYFAPESFFGKQNRDKSCVFSLGVCIMETMLMQSMSTCYDPETGKLDQKEFLVKTQKLRSRNCNQTLVDFVLQMLATDHRKRPHFTQLQERLFVLLKDERTQFLFPQTLYSSQASDKRITEIVCQVQLVTECLQPMIAQSNQMESPNIQTPECLDQQTPDDVDEDAPSQGGNSRVLQSSSRVNLESLEGKHVSYFEKTTEPIFTDPSLLEMLRKDIQHINMKRSKHSEPCVSTAIPTRNEVKESFRDKPILQSKPIDTLESDQLQFVSQNYSKGRYEGQKRGPIRQGYGTFYYNEGGRYTGYWRNNKMEGSGTLYYSNNKIAYEGGWFQDHLQGSGCLYNQSPLSLNHGYDYRSFQQVDVYWTKFQGHFVDDNKSGKGKLTLSNNQMFEGEFYKDAVHGEGTFFASGGQIIKGEWYQNRLVKQLSKR